MKPTLITLGAVTTLAIGAIALTPEKPTVVPDTATTTQKVALPEQAVQNWMAQRGINHGNAPHVYQMLVDEAPPVVDISQVSLAEVAAEFAALLDESDVDTALKGRSANDILIEKAERDY